MTSTSAGTDPVPTSIRVAAVAWYLLSLAFAILAVLLVVATVRSGPLDVLNIALAVIFTLLLIGLATATHLGGRWLTRRRDASRAQRLGTLIALLSGIAVIRAIAWGEVLKPEALPYPAFLILSVLAISLPSTATAKAWLSQGRHQ